MIVATAVTAKAPLRCEGLKVSRMIACWVGCRPPPNRPCRQRNTTSSDRLWASPHRKENTVKPTMQMRK